jgi:mannose-1-phosphate guanylyltransferase
MAAENNLYQFVLPGFWMDIGQPLDYLKGQVMYLESLRSSKSAALSQTADGDSVPVIVGNVLIDPTAKIGANCVIGPNAVIGPNVVVGDGAFIAESAILAGVKVSPSAYIISSIVGWESVIGRWAHIGPHTFLGKDVSVGQGVTVMNGVKVAPHKGIKDDVLSAKDVM